MSSVLSVLGWAFIPVLFSLAAGILGFTCGGARGENLLFFLAAAVVFWLSGVYVVSAVLFGTMGTKPAVFWGTTGGAALVSFLLALFVITSFFNSSGTGNWN